MPRTDPVFLAQYRRHAANCFHRVGKLRIVDGCLTDGPPLAGCAIGEALHRLATRKQEPVAPSVMLGLMQ